MHLYEDNCLGRLQGSFSSPLITNKFSFNPFNSTLYFYVFYSLKLPGGTPKPANPTGNPLLAAAEKLATAV